jgi:hypothetical protein
MQYSKAYRAHEKVILTLVGMTVLFLASCSSTTPPIVQKPSGFDSNFHYELPVGNIRALVASSGEQYVLWLRLRTDSGLVWDAVQLTVPYRLPNDSLKWYGNLTLHESPDSIVLAVLSIEPMVIPSTPTSKLIAGAFTGGSMNAAFLSAVDSNGIGDISNASGSVIFTTKSADTNRAKQEFYLMQLNNGVTTASVQNLPIPKAGWTYGLWVLDSNFYPMHQFFYGYFSDATGPDSEPSDNEYPFPGGFKPPMLNDPGARLEVTLEPTFAVQSNAPLAPSPMPVLWVQLQRFLDFNQSLELQNAWPASSPSGTLTINQ